jgi:phosphohistidine phosphatase
MCSSITNNLKSIILKKVIIVRHAKSSWDDFRMTDFDRPLDQRGLRDAPNMAKLLKAEGLKPDIIYTSDANRAQTTANFFASEFDMEINKKHSLYHGAPDDYLDVIRMENDQYQTIALFGHNPGITFLTNLISSGSTDNIPTCGIIIAGYVGKLWSDCDWSGLKLIKILTPKTNT